MIRLTYFMNYTNISSFPPSAPVAHNKTCTLDGQQSDEILQMFAGTRKIASQKYRRFIADGVAMGKRNELVGGGLRRSRKLAGAECFEAYDERILGSGDFVEQLWKECEADEAPESVMPIPERAGDSAVI